ncbi:hypothetical protein L9F63_015236, partial [Diploptera punctata]
LTLASLITTVHSLRSVALFLQFVIPIFQPTEYVLINCTHILQNFIIHYLFLDVAFFH